MRNKEQQDQYIQLLEKQGETDHKSVFVDGTKIESRAGRYTFNWRGTAEKNLKKTKKYKSQIGRIENMKYDKDDDCFICAEGRKLFCRKVSTEVHNGIPVTRAWYRCEDCRNCPQREKGCRKQDVNEPKEVVMKETFWEKRQQSLENITSERGIHLRMNRSIQVEGAFGLIKNDFGFRRFLSNFYKTQHRLPQKVQKEDCCKTFILQQSRVAVAKGEPNYVRKLYPSTQVAVDYQQPTWPRYDP